MSELSKIILAFADNNSFHNESDNLKIIVNQDNIKIPQFFNRIFQEQADVYGFIPPGFQVNNIEKFNNSLINSNILASYADFTNFYGINVYLPSIVLFRKTQINAVFPVFTKRTDIRFNDKLQGLYICDFIKQLSNIGLVHHIPSVLSKETIQMNLEDFQKDYVESTA